MSPVWYTKHALRCSCSCSARQGADWGADRRAMHAVASHWYGAAAAVTEHGMLAVRLDKRNSRHVRFLFHRLKHLPFKPAL